MCRAARDAHAVARAGGRGVMAAPPSGSRMIGLALHRSQAIANGEGAGLPEIETSGGGLGKLRSEGGHRHAAQRSADHGGELLDPKRAHCRIGGTGNVLDGQLGKPMP